MTEETRLSFDVQEWLPVEDGDPWGRTFEGVLKIRVNQIVINRPFNELASSYAEGSNICLKTFALWLMENWWRLHHEPISDARRTDIDWRMAHELPSAGSGYIWPPLSIVSDGERVTFHMSASELVEANLRYDHQVTQTAQLSDFTQAIDGVVRKVIERGDARSADLDGLNELWRHVKDESADPNISRLRRAEALMGLDAEELQIDELDRLLDPLAWAGPAAIDEVLAVAAISGIQQHISSFAALEHQGVWEGEMAEVRALVRTSPEAVSGEPWKRGAELARNLRAEVGLDDGPLESDKLKDLFGLSSEEMEKLVEGDSGFSGPTGFQAAAVRSRDEETRCTFLASGRHPISRRFKLSRALGDVLLCDTSERLSPATHARTARQKANRAFAQELLLPTQILEERVRADGYSESTRERLAEEYGVSTELVATTAVNKGFADRDELQRWEG